MQTYEILVRNRAILPNSPDMTLVRTSVGIDQMHVLFDNDEWLGFPITITFAQGDVAVTDSLVVSQIASNGEWVAEATVTVPYEVIRMVGPIRVTLQGTDSDGNHIITAKGAPISVEEAGDVVMGDIPSDAPTVDQWQQAYAQAMAAVGEAASLVSNLQGMLDSMVEEAKEDVTTAFEDRFVPATTESLGLVQIGEGLSVTDEGVVSANVTETGGLTNAQKSLLANLQLLAYYAFETNFDSQGVLQDDIKVRTSAVPLAKISAVGAVKVDNDTTIVDADGTIHAKQFALEAATDEALGGVMPDGTTIQNDGGAISARTADVGVLGVVKPDGTTISIAEDGTITATGGGGGGGYVLPTASESQLGGVMVDGETIGITDGVISVIVGNADEVGF